MSHGGGGGLKSVEKCHILFEWPLNPNLHVTFFCLISPQEICHFEVIFVVPELRDILVDV